MRTTVILKDRLLKEAMEATGIKEKTALIHRGLEELIYRAAAERILKLGGTNPKATAAPRRRRPHK